MVREGFNFKVTLGRTRNSHPNFVEWAEKTQAVKLTNSAKKALQRDSSWGGAHFYARDDKALTMARMFLGEGIGRIDRVIKATQPKK